MLTSIKISTTCHIFHVLVFSAATFNMHLVSICTLLSLENVQPEVPEHQPSQARWKRGKDGRLEDKIRAWSCSENIIGAQRFSSSSR